jgi:hypothetical protein
MDGERLRVYWSNEIEAMINTYKQFENLIPAKGRTGAAHNGEDGRYVEDLLKEYLKKYLPSNLEVLTGFILRPATKLGGNNKSRKGDLDSHSTQLDIIIYDTSNYPIFQRYGDNVIVPPEGVIAVISVKKQLRKNDIEVELNSLKNVAKLCIQQDRNKKGIRGPFLALVSMNCNIYNTIEKEASLVFKTLMEMFPSKGCNRYDEMPGFIGSLSQWSVHKSQPKGDNADYFLFKHKEDEKHMGFQFLLTEILGVYYNDTRNIVKKPGFTSFLSGRGYDQNLGKLEFARIRGL